MSETKKDNQETTEKSSSIHTVIIRPIPDDLADIFSEYKACIKARDDMINKRILGYKKGKKFAIDAEKARQKFWNKAYKLYPECLDEDSNATYYHNEQIIRIKKVV